jgi:hypothetical protein
MEVIDTDRPAKVRIALEFEKPFKSSNTTEFLITSQQSGRSLVIWKMTGPKSLAVKIMSIFTSMDSMIGKDFERGLAQLKSVVEAEPPS